MRSAFAAGAVVSRSRNARGNTTSASMMRLGRRSITSRAQRSDSAEPFRYSGLWMSWIESPGGADGRGGRHLIRAVTNDDRRALHAGSVEGFQHPREDRPASDGQQRFLRSVGKRGEPPGHSRGQDDGRHLTVSHEGAQESHRMGAASSPFVNLADWWYHCRWHGGRGS